LIGKFLKTNKNGKRKFPRVTGGCTVREMAELTKKKRGKPRKPVFVVRLADVQKEWNQRLRRAGSPEEKGSKFEISAQRLPWTDRDSYGRKIRPTKVTYGNSWDHKSATLLTAPELSLQETAVDESVVLSVAWMRYLEYMGVIAEALSRKDKGVDLKRLSLEDARSRSGEPPPTIPAELGTPVEFKQRLVDHELEIRRRVDRRQHVIIIRVYPLPPHVDEDLDETQDPRGHWEGLKWLPDPQQ
jgi:hypothetical protein